MSNLDEESLLKLAKLCRIECSEEELQTLLKSLQSIISYFNELQEVDTENTPPCNHISDADINVMREDEPGETLQRDLFLANSPSHVGGMIRVPPVIKF